MAHSKAEKVAACQTYFARGATAAALEAGVSRQSVYTWLAELDTVNTKKGEQSRAATAERLALKRQAMVEMVHDTALQLLAAIDPADVNTARWSIPAATFVDKSLMLAGIIRRADPVRLTTGELQALISDLEAELISQGKPLPGRDVAFDREWEKLREELERKVASEMLSEIDAELARRIHSPEELERNRLMGNVVRRRLDGPFPYNGDHPPDAA